MTTTATTTHPAADRLRAEAAQHDRDAHESFDRCDTDGFLSQWASGLTAQQKRMEARLIENGGLAEFPVLLDADTGEPVPARLVEGRYGQTWAIFNTPEDALTGSGAEVVKWVSAFPARESTIVRKGFREAFCLAPARVVMAGANACNVRPIHVRTDRGFDPTAPVVSEWEYRS